MKKPLFYLILGTSLIINACTTKDMAINKENLDTNVLPGDDFYEFASGGWIKNNPLPAEYSRYGSFDKLIESNQEMVKSLVMSASEAESELSGIAKKVGDFYYTGMDTAEIEAEGVKPLSEEFSIISMASNKSDVQNLIIRNHIRDNTLLFYLFGSPDKKNSKMVIANIYQGGLGLADVDYYTDMDDKAKEIRDKYKDYISGMLVLAGEDQENAKIEAQTILNMETRLAKASMTRLERRNPHATYNKMSIDELKKLTPAIDWQNYLSSIGLNKLEEINVAQPKFFKEVDAMMNDTPIEDWKIYLKWHSLNNAAAYLSDDFINTSFDFYGKYLSGKQVLQPRWKRVLQTTDEAMGEAIGKMFVDKYFPPEAKERMLNLVANLKEGLKTRIDDLEWMSEDTKVEARNKLAAMNVKIGYPDKWRDFSDLNIQKDSYFANMQSASKFNFEYRIAKIGKAVDPDEWGMFAHQVNAYYSPLRNEIVFPAGILQPPFFYIDADDAVNYGAIGVVIGHEMTHGFDDQGRQYDMDGNLRDWWTKEDAEKFNARTEVLVKQFDQFIVIDSMHANGKLTLGENIADLGGLSVAFTALNKQWETTPPEKSINGFTPAQRFFLSYSNLWAQNITSEEIRKRTKEDVHSIGKLRVNGPLPNLQFFYDAFNIDETANLYIKPEERAVIW
jgi:putative endopeptidase